MKAKTIEEEEYSEMLQKCYDFVKNEAHQSMRNKANRDVVDYYDDFAYEIKKFLEQKLIQPEPQTVGEEDIWNKEQMEKVKDYILTESSKQTEEQKKHIIDFANRLSETKQEQKAMKSKHTAVDWLIEQLTPSISLQQKHIDDLKTQAKEIEKEQIMNAYVEGCSDSILDESTDKTRSEDYYNENYGK